MKDEIKEILQDVIDDIYQCGEYIDQAKNHITNLQEENKKLKDLCNKYEEEHNNAFKLWTMKMEEMPDYEERMNYKLRNEKAIEYINKYKNQNWYIESRFTEELLKILKGKSDE